MRSIKPGRGPSCIGGVGSLIAVGFGVIWTIMAFTITSNSPFPIVGWAFPLFGIVFIISGLAMAAYNFFNATTKNRLSVIDITSSKEEQDILNERFGKHVDEKEAMEQRLNNLKDMKTKGVITEAEFLEQRRRVLEEI